MTFTSFPLRVRAALLEQIERTKQTSKADIEQLIEESELKIIYLQSVELCDQEQACVAALRYLISPIRTLPVELLAEIFGLAVHDATHIKDAFRISHVCSDWRQVAHSTPRLWTRNLRVLISSSDDNVYADGLKDWLARSAPLPVLRIAPRWRSLKFIRTPPDWLVRRAADCRLEGLEELSLDVSNIDPDIILSLTAPRLRKLVLHNYSSAAPILVMPWLQLADLTFSYGRNSSHPDVLFDILAECLNLVRLSVFVVLVLPTTGRATPAFSRLRTLYVHYFGVPGHGASFLDTVSAPALEELCLDFGDLRSPNITGLDLRYSQLTSNDLMAVFRQTLSLTRLKLKYCDFCLDDALIGALCCQDGVKPLVPYLHYLVLEHMPFTDNIQDILARMIASRWRSDAELGPHLVPAVARWTLVRLQGVFGPRFVNMMEVLQRTALPVELVLL
ncbi:hypothetical protein DFH08DRAFT_1075720 [Mycena albidolilacea]|uniref:F-box domain-containing protein n=1 Tax=Mycena albidolilacea TaxID=1033008 RepID=A0AAD7AE91_9AGAR|nr:hypothetical protein DFH08DRAFT_1075720 [Mycena albidolilacea]